MAKVKSGPGPAQSLWLFAGEGQKTPRNHLHGSRETVSTFRARPVPKVGCVTTIFRLKGSQVHSAIGSTRPEKATFFAFLYNDPSNPALLNQSHGGF